MVLSLNDLPKKVQYLMIDSRYVQGTNNTFTIDMSLESNVHLEDLNRVIGLKIIDFYAIHVGDNDATGNGNVAKYIDVICPDIPKRGQIMDERKGQVLTRVPLERSFSGSNSFVLNDKHWKSFNRKTNLFNPISIQKLHFELYESQGDGDYHLLSPDVGFYMIIEILTIDVEEKPENKEDQILEALYKLIGKIDALNENVKKIPEKENKDDLKKRKYPFSYLFLIISLLVGGYIYYVNSSSSS